MDKDFFDKWFEGFGEGLDKMSNEECSRFFSKCAYNCSRDALKNLYRDLFEECEKDLDRFFVRLEEKKNVKGRVVESGKIYEKNNCRICVIEYIYADCLFRLQDEPGTIFQTIW